MSNRTPPPKVYTYHVREIDGVPKLFRVVWTPLEGTVIWFRSDGVGYGTGDTPSGHRTRARAIAAYRRHKLDQADGCRRTANEWLGKARGCERLAKAEVESETD